MSLCQYENQCGGCPTIAEPLDSQKKAKLKFLALRLNVTSDFINWMAPGSVRLRDRADLTWIKGQGLGLYHKDKYEIVDLENCPMMSAPLEKWMQDFRKIPPPVNKGSIRLRIGPNGERGVWLDFANVDIKTLLDEKAYLETLLSQAHVEIGQKRKVLGVKEGQLKLLDPEPRVWFQTYVEEQAVPLVSSIADFTQVSMSSNRLLVNTAMQMLTDAKVKTVAEFGSGIGNFTLPLSQRFDRVLAFEMDRFSSAMLEQNLLAFGSREKVEIFHGDFQRLNEKRTVDFTNVDAVLVDPPRSGVQNFIDPLLTSVKKPLHFIYVSCFPESFASDLERLKAVGYRLVDLAVIDQFPHSAHMELVAHLSLNANAN